MPEPFERWTLPPEPEPPAVAAESSSLSPSMTTQYEPWQPLEPVPPAFEPLPEPAALPPPRRAASNTFGWLAAALILLAAGAFAIWNFGSNAPEPSPTVSTAPQTPPADAPAPAPEPPPPVAAAPAPDEMEISTIRLVWVRVIADGERVIERELSADSRVPFKAQKTITIRTGDAGAVRLSIAGEDQGFLGEEGEVITRTFTIQDDTVR
jgi:hypothetical protein